MFSKNPVTLAIINTAGKVIALKQGVTLANVGKHFPMKNGNPVVGPNVRRLLTLKEIMANGLATSKNKAGEMQRSTPELCLAPLETAAVAA